MIDTGILLWIFFGLIIVVLLALDLGVFHRKSHAVSIREAAVWTAVWVTVAIAFNVVVYFWKGTPSALEFLTGYVIEESLSVDNLFVFVILFRSFSVAPEHQHRVLFWGILGALVMRGLLIAGGTALIEHFYWTIYIFGAFLVYTGIKIFFERQTQMDPQHNPVLRVARKFLPITENDGDGKFWVRNHHKLLFTPLFLVLITVEITDLIFALDSIPAIFGVTTDPFIVYTSNIFAIMGLRSLYFLISGTVEKFYYLKPALSVILTFVGVKMLISHFYKIPIMASLLVIISVLVIAILASWLRKKRQDQLLKES